MNERVAPELLVPDTGEDASLLTGKEALLVSPEVKKKFDFRPLADGERAHYFVPDHGAETLVERHGDEYRFSYRDGSWSTPQTNAEIRSFAKREQWQFLSQGISPEVVERERLALLAVGETAQYFVPELKASYTVARTKEGYHFFNTEYDSDFLTDEQMKETIRTAGWTYVEGSKQAAPVQSERVPDIYDELRAGDIWVKRDAKGAFVRAIHIDDFIDIGGVQVAFEELDESLELEESVRETDPDSLIQGDAHTKRSLNIDRVRTDLRAGGYTRVTIGTTLEPRVRVVEVEPEPIVLALNVGESAIYARPASTDDGVGEGVTFLPVKIQRKKSGYTVESGYGKVGYTKLSYEVVENMAREEGWVPYEEADQIQPTEGMKTFDITTAESETITRLRQAVATTRQDYVNTQYQDRSAWMKVRRFFGKDLDKGVASPDTEVMRQRYQSALDELRAAQVAEMQSDTSNRGSILLERMSQMLQYYEFDERANLALTVDQVKIEQGKNWGQAVIVTAEKLGRRYNELSRKQKYLIAGACITAGIGSGLVGGSAVAAMGAVTFARRLVTTAGLAVGADAYLEKRQEGKRIIAFQEKRDEELIALRQPEDALSQEASLEEQIGRLNIMLEKKIRALDVEIVKKEKGRRRLLAWGGAAIASFGGGALVSHLMREVLPSMPQYQALLGKIAAGQSWVSEQVASIVQSLTESGDPVVEEPHLPPLEPLDMNVTVEESPLGSPTGPPEIFPRNLLVPSPETGALLEEHVVTSADSRGLWGILEERLQGVAPADRPRVIQTLLNVAKHKVDAWSPEARVAAGLSPDGDMNTIVAGKHILFERLFTPEEIESVRGDSSVAVSEHVSPDPVASGERLVGADTPPTRVETGDDSLRERVRDTSAQVATPVEQAVFDEKISQIQETPLRPQNVPVSVPAEVKAGTLLEEKRVAAERLAYQEKELAEARLMEQQTEQAPRFAVAPAPEQVQMMLQTTGDIRKALFLTPALMADTQMNAPFDYTINRGAMGFVQMGRITERFAEMHSSQMPRFNRYLSSFPLHPTQVERVVRLVALAQDPRFFGGAGAPLPVETIDQYTRRIANLALSSGKEQSLLRFIHGRR